MDVTINIPETHLFEADGLAALRARLAAEGTLG